MFSKDLFNSEKYILITYSKWNLFSRNVLVPVMSQAEGFTNIRCLQYARFRFMVLVYSVQVILDAYFKLQEKN